MDYGWQLGRQLEERITEHVRYASTERENRGRRGVNGDGCEWMGWRNRWGHRLTKAKNV